MGAFVVTSILNYAFGVAMGWFFSPAQYGVLGVAQSLLLLVALVVGSGFAWTTTHDIAASGVTGETRHRFRAAWLVNVFLALALGGGLWAAYAWGGLFEGSAYRTVVPLIGLTAVLLAARSVVNGALRGLYRFDALATNQIGEVVAKAGAGLILVAAGAGVAGVMAGFALGTAVALAHSLWVTRQARLWQGQGWLDRRVIATTAPLFVGMVGTALMINLDILGLKLLAPAGASDELAGYYQAAVILARMPVFVAQTLTLVLFSYVTGARARQEAGGLGTAEYARDAVRAWARLILPVGLVLMLAPHAVLSLVFPARYQVAAPSLQVASAGGMFLALATLLIAVLQAAGNRRRPAVVAAIAIAVQVVALVLLVPRLGPQGAAISLLAAGAVTVLGLVPAFVPWFRPGFRLNLRPFVPLLALMLPLLLIADEGREMALLKLGLAGLGYLVALVAVNARALGEPWRPNVRGVTQVFQLLLGGY
jgi:O-antigen/teichoic acid export membrane protein